MGLAGSDAVRAVWLRTHADTAGEEHGEVSLDSRHAAAPDGARSAAPPRLSLPGLSEAAARADSPRITERPPEGHRATPSSSPRHDPASATRRGLPPRQQSLGTAILVCGWGALASCVLTAALALQTLRAKRRSAAVGERLGDFDGATTVQEDNYSPKQVFDHRVMRQTRGTHEASEAHKALEHRNDDVIDF